jgi:hypothetical protein
MADISKETNRCVVLNKPLDIAFVSKLYIIIENKRMTDIFLYRKIALSLKLVMEVML